MSYIRQHHATYTREAITDVLLGAGYDLESIEAGWRQVALEAEPPNLRPSWKLMLTLLVLGSVGAFAVWQGQLYRAGALAAVIYLGVAAPVIAVGYLVVWLANRGHSLGAALSLAAIGLALGFFVSGGSATFVSVAITALFVAIALALVLTGPDRRRVAMVAALVPILLWLVVTGTCYAPLLRGG